MPVDLDKDDETNAVDGEPTAERARTDAEEIEVPKPRPRSAAAPKSATAAPAGGAVTLSLSLLVKVLGAVAAVLLIVAGFTTYKWLDTRSDLTDARAAVAARAQADTRADENKRAEEIATKYAVGAATVDYANLGPWQQALVAGTTDQLGAQLKQAAAQMEQLFVPLQWNSTATPIGALTKSNQDGVIVVNVFVNMVIKSTQMPEGIPSTATYAVTVDKNQSWKISEVGGIDQMIGKK